MATCSQSFTPITACYATLIWAGLQHLNVTPLKTSVKYFFLRSDLCFSPTSVHLRGFNSFLANLFRVPLRLRGRTSSLRIVYILTYTGFRFPLMCRRGRLGPIGQNTRLVRTTMGAWFGALLSEEPLTLKVLTALQLNEGT